VLRSIVQEEPTTTPPDDEPLELELLELEEPLLEDCGVLPLEELLETLPLELLLLDELLQPRTPQPLLEPLEDELLPLELDPEEPELEEAAPPHTPPTQAS
jgi:hypothetical protein